MPIPSLFGCSHWTGRLDTRSFMLEHLQMSKDVGARPNSLMMGALHNI